MIIANETSMGYQMTPDLSTASHDDHGLFQNSLVEEANSSNSTIFSDKIGMYLDYTHYNCGEFPDSSFFAEMFPACDYTLTDDGCFEMLADFDRVVGYYSPNGYSVYFEYAPQSTAENPVMNVRLCNHKTGEAWEGTMNLNEIDPRNASKIEMIVLSSHMTGDPTAFLMSTTGFDHPTAESDWTSILSEMLESAKALASASGHAPYLEELEDLMLNLGAFTSETDDSASKYYADAQMEQKLRQELELRQLRFQFA